MGSRETEQLNTGQSNTDQTTTHQSTTNQLTTEQIQRRLVEISDDLRKLEHDDFMGKHRLYAEADELRSHLAELESDQPDASSQWADRAARKASHTINQKAAEAMLDQHMDGGMA